MGNKENIFAVYGRVIYHYETAIVHSFSKSNHHHTIITVTLSLLGNIWLLLFNELLVPCVEISYRFGPICTYVFTNMFLLNFSISSFFFFLSLFLVKLKVVSATFGPIATFFALLLFIALVLLILKPGIIKANTILKNTISAK